MSIEKPRSAVSGSQKQNQNLTIIVVTVVIAVVGVVAAIALSGSGGSSGSGVNYDEIPQSRTQDGGFVLGNPDAPITIVEFADFLCPHCQEYKSEIDKVIEDYVATGQAKFEYRAFPVIDPTQSYYVAKLAECAAEQKDSGFWLAHDELFRLASRGVGENIARELAKNIDINFSELLQCTRDANQVETDYRLGTQTGISGTPGIRVRYEDGNLQVFPGYDRGGPSASVLGAAIAAANVQAQ